jgi:cell division protein FtsW
VPWRQLGKLIGTIGVAAALFVSLLLLPYKTLDSLPGLNRLTTWKARVERFFEKSDPVPPARFSITDENFQETHATMAIALSNGIGRGPGNSVERDVLPQAYSDFIFAIIIEELGIWGATLVVFFYIVLIFRAWRIASRCGTLFPAFLIIGLAFMLTSQAIINMMVAVGLFPVTGQPLPLISRGGTAMLIFCFYFGMMLSVSNSAKQKAELPAEN